MQEYTLTSYSQGCDLQEEWALCRIYKKVKGSGGTKRAQSYSSMSASTLNIPTQNIDPSESYMPKMKRAKTLNGFSLPPNNDAPTTSEMIFSQKDHDQYLPPFDHPQSSTHYYGSETGSTAPASVNAPFSTMGILSVNPILLDGDDDEPNNGGGNRQPLSKEDDVQCYIEDNGGMLISDAYSSQFIDQAPPAAQGSPAGLSDLQYVDYNGLIASTVEDDLGPLAEDLSIKEDDMQHYLLEDDVGMLSDDYSSQFFDQAPPAAQGSHAGLSDLQYVDYNSLASIEEVDLSPLPKDGSIKDQSSLPLLSEEDDETIFQRLASSDGCYSRLQEDSDNWCLSSSAMEMSSDLLPPVNRDQIFEDLLKVMEEHDIQTSDILE
ncbi:hypothetical protein FRX31_011385 [Thalictrum thalictroides]|uniref:NAC domain-containing protein n=1 Tax=Thalictrum thalictroides TaxID=46969 RepID=A0A7J6WQ13_THATH|nr:hypothetical protein FRX31_011385 [Thalictrum thalictroides]